MWNWLRGSQVSKARPGAPFDCFRRCIGMTKVAGDSRREYAADGEVLWDWTEPQLLQQVLVACIAAASVEDGIDP